MSTIDLPPLPDLGPEWTPYWREFMARTLREYAEKAVAAERERAGKIIEGLTIQMTKRCPSAVNGFWPDQVGYQCIRAIDPESKI
jgi:hypothetical protein